MSCDCDCSTKVEEAEFSVCSSCETASKCEEAGECYAKAYVEENRPSCGPGEEFKNGKCQAISVTIELDIDKAMTIVEAETGKSIIQISGIAFHEGFNKNNWSIAKSGVDAVITQMVGADLTLKHPKPDHAGFSRNMDGGVEEAVVGTIKEAWLEEIEGGWNVRYIAHVVRVELFEALESGLWTRGDYGVSIGGYGVPDEESEEGVVFASDFTFDHLAIVHRPAYERANIETVEKIQAESNPEILEMPAEPVLASEVEATLKYQPEPKTNRQQELHTMSDEEMTNEIEDDSANLIAEIEDLKAQAVLREAAIAEFEAQEASRAEEERLALVEKASEMGLKGHEEFGSETLQSMIASWENSRPTFEPATPAITPPSEVVASEEPQAVVSNYLNGTLVANDESLYARAYNAWASAWNRTLSGLEVNEGMKAKTYQEVKENL